MLGRQLSLRARLIVAAASAVAVAVLLAGAGALVTVRHELRYQVDESLLRTAAPVSQQRGLTALEGRRAYQLLLPDGTVFASNGSPLSVTSRDRDVAAGRRVTNRHDAVLDGLHVRVLTVGIVGGGAAQLVAPLDAVDATVKHLFVLLAFLIIGGVALAVALGMLVARAALVPVDRLTAAAERVATTMDLSETIDVQGADEIARLGQALNALLSTIDQHQHAQRRLVADASHELRTPLTSMRTNLEVLARSPDMSPEERQTILSDLVAQAAEMSTLVGQLVDLEREPLGHEPRTELDYEEIVTAAVERARLHTPGFRFVVNTEPTIVRGQPGVLERAVANLLDNAAKWSPPGGEIDVQLVGGTLSVRDHGPGIDAADAPHVWERFYRSARARALPGSGLGLSIVRQAAEDHGGQAWLLPAPGGGTIACLRIPLASDSAGTAGWSEPPPPVSDPRLSA
jgi:two-component system sensor histidine kinase MprB